MPAFEIDPKLVSVIAGNLEANTFEQNPISPSTLIRSDQNWGVKVTMDMTGALLNLTPYVWKISLYLEDLTPADHDYQFPMPPAAFPMSVNTDPALSPQHYEETILVAHDAVANGVYKPTVLVQLYNDPVGSAPGTPMGIAAFAELSIIDIYPV